MSAYYYSDEVSRLLMVLQEATRPTPRGGPDIYVPPAGGDLAEANYHHFIFGRRGSGKTSLLRHLQSQLETEGRIAAWVDQEVFSNLSYPDVLVSAVLEVVQGISQTIERKCASSHTADSRKLRKLFAKARSENEALRVLAAMLEQVIENLRVLKFAPLDRKVEWVRKEGAESQAGVIGEVRVAGASVSGTTSEGTSSEWQTTEVIESTKEDYLERSLVEFRRLLIEAAQYCDGGFLFVDDLYLISTNDQPLVLGYLHRLVKDTGLWLKVGSIRYFTVTYLRGDPPCGMELGHDALEIALDRGMRLYGSTKAFLEAIFTRLAESVGVNLNELLTEGARDRLMLAPGGVARDYLRLAGGAIDQARNRGPSSKSGTTRIIVEDVNQAAGQLSSSKFDAMHQDAPERVSVLAERVRDVTEYCRAMRKAYFLVSLEDRLLTDEVAALQHLRFTHLLHESETIPDKGSERFNVWMLDVAELAAQRATQQVDFDGWRKREKRRNRGNIYTPSWRTDGASVTPSRDARGRFLHTQGPQTSPPPGNTHEQRSLFEEQ